MNHRNKILLCSLLALCALSCSSDYKETRQVGLDGIIFNNSNCSWGKVAEKRLFGTRKTYKILDFDFALYSRHTIRVKEVSASTYLVKIWGYYLAGWYGVEPNIPQKICLNVRLQISSGEVRWSDGMPFDLPIELSKSQRTITTQIGCTSTSNWTSFDLRNKPLEFRIKYESAQHSTFDIKAFDIDVSGEVSVNGKNEKLSIRFRGSEFQPPKIESCEESGGSGASW